MYLDLAKKTEVRWNRYKVAVDAEEGRLFLGLLMISSTSLARHKFSDESEAAINEQINFFKDSSLEERGHADTFMENQISKFDEKEQCNESLIPSKDERTISTVSSGRRVVVTRMISFAGSRIQVPYVSHVRRSRPRENIMALWEFHSGLWEVKATSEESNLNLSQYQLNNIIEIKCNQKEASSSLVSL